MRRVVHVRAQRAGQQFCLDEHELPVAHFFLKQRMRGFLQFPLLVGRDEGLAGGIGQFHRPTVARHKLRGFQFATIEQGERESLHPRAKLFHEIEGEGFSAGAVGVQKTDEGIEADGGERRDAVVAQ